MSGDTPTPEQVAEQREAAVAWLTDKQRLEQAHAILNELRHHIDMANTCLERAANAGIEATVTSGYNRVPGIAREVELMRFGLAKFAMVFK